MIKQWSTINLKTMATELSVEGFENHVQGHFLKVFHITNLKGFSTFLQYKIKTVWP